MPTARKPSAKKNKNKSKSKPKAKAKAKQAARPKAKVAAKPKAKPTARPKAKVAAKLKAQPKAAAKPAPKPKGTAARPRAKAVGAGLMPNHLVAARLLRHAAELFIAVGKQNPKAEKTMILRAKIIETAADRVEADPMGGFEPIEGDEL